MASDGSISFLSVCSMCCISTECDFELLRAANVTAATVAIRSSMQRVFLIIVQWIYFFNFFCFNTCKNCFNIHRQRLHKDISVYHVKKLKKHYKRISIYYDLYLLPKQKIAKQTGNAFYPSCYWRYICYFDTYYFIFNYF